MSLEVFVGDNRVGGVFQRKTGYVVLGKWVEHDWWFDVRENMFETIEDAQKFIAELIEYYENRKEQEGQRHIEKLRIVYRIVLDREVVT